MGFSENRSPKRFLSLWLPRLPTDRVRRTQKPGGAPEPLVVAEKRENALRISALDARAARLGLREGMPLADARAMVQALTVVEADAVADAKLLGAVADWCERFTPLVALDGPHGLLLDVTGATHLFGGEATLLDTVRHAIARQGFAVQGAMAGTAMAARALAHYADGTIAQPGEEALVVAPLPIAALELDPKATHGLRSAGLKTIGQVATRLRSELASRFGMDMVAELDHALGRAEKPVTARRKLAEFMAEHRFAEPVVSDDVVFGSIFALGKALASSMEEHRRGARRIEAAFFRTDGAVRRIAVEMGRPTRDPKVIERLFRERMKSLADPLDVGFGFDLIRLEACDTDKAASEAIGFEAGNETEQEIGFLIDRLAARFGADHVLRFQTQDTHIPEASAVAVPAQFAAPSKLEWEVKRGLGEAPRRPLRLLERPEAIDVMAEVPDGPPIRFRWRRVLHGVTRAEGPERIAMEWWRMQEARPTRDYFRVEDEEGRRFWLFRSGLWRETDSPRWFIHGLFA